MKTQHILASLLVAGTTLGTIGYVHAQAAGRSGDFRLQRVDPPAAGAPAMNSEAAANPSMPVTDVGTPRAPRPDRN